MLDVPTAVVEGHVCWIRGIDRIRSCVHRLRQGGDGNDLAWIKAESSE